MKTANFKINSKHFLYSGLVISFCLLCSGLSSLLSRSDFLAKKEKPMLAEDVAFLCEKLETKSNAVCISGQAVYPKDFSDLISEKFDTPPTTYQDFQNAFIQFQTKTIIETNPNVIISTYDLNRDGEYDLMPYFDGTLEDNVIRFIVFKESF
jgi:hypothetical protein